MFKCIRAKVYGRVQGVYFRQYTFLKAKELNLVGFVKNESDGSVLVVAQGFQDQLDKFIEFLHQGSPASQVERVEWEYQPLHFFQRFEVIR
ncbi:acylphosphatase [Schleiferia thermophila]|jgi:acylphosphatase|uniref:Acylphosphatase n=1 Tax=Schleiferia thermophila TaxID=884107 RepID=A0A368ZYZ9_9FLAO|nr:acylphosphatase [Schleiferia thermophila]KFD38126.1 hypothetical protein AT05_11660 [Schleiferia thermophila str. Yellowstone]RCX02139.1 acylphosphatase [Schleiferia thermophila]GCD80660.1 acylphosphatase [Schleiferia thermophila]